MDELRNKENNADVTLLIFLCIHIFLTHEDRKSILNEISLEALNNIKDSAYDVSLLLLFHFHTHYILGIQTVLKYFKTI